MAQGMLDDFLSGESQRDTVLSLVQDLDEDQPRLQRELRDRVARFAADLHRRDPALRQERLAAAVHDHWVQYAKELAGVTELGEWRTETLVAIVQRAIAEVLAPGTVRQEGRPSLD